MKILIIGGKKFAGIYMVKAAMERGHEVTLFNRGKTNPELFPELKCINGDRVNDLAKLDGLEFDAVIDTSCFFPYQMRASSEYFKNKVKLYVFISSLTVHDMRQKVMVETDKIIEYDFESTEIKKNNSLEGTNYGAMKAACEKLLQDAFDKDTALVLRTGFICGDRDYTDKFTYWPMKMHFNDNIIAPINDVVIQFIDVKDLGRFTIKCVESLASGIYGVTGNKMMFSEWLELCRKVVNSKCNIIKLNNEQLNMYGLLSPTKVDNFPLVYDELPGIYGMYGADCQKAISSGLTFVSPVDTIRDAVNWYLSTGRNDNEAVTGLKGDREREIIADLKNFKL